MTEIRIYEDHDKIIISSETSSPNDKLFELAIAAGIEEEWNDGEWSYRRGSLSKFMSLLRKETEQEL